MDDALRPIRFPVELDDALVHIRLLAQQRHGFLVDRRSTRRAMRKAFSAVETLYAACDQAGNSRRGATGASIHSISCTPVSSRARAGGSASTMLWVQWHPKLGPAGSACTLSIRVPLDFYTSL